MDEIERGQTVWCRTASGTWVKYTAAGPAHRASQRDPRPIVEVLGWYRDRPDKPVNWPAEDVRTTEPEHT